ncbi:MAG: rod-binding protein [Caulobacterales bacterium]|nr:rod-binding protein [Caulobacterales bacterium]
MTPDATAAGLLDTALLTRQSAPMANAPSSPEEAMKAAKAFEAFFLTQTFEFMQRDIETAPPFGGGNGERAWRSFLSEAYAQSVVEAGGVGLADQLASELLALQEKESATWP